MVSNKSKFRHSITLIVIIKLFLGSVLTFESGADSFKVALLIPGEVNDGSWNSLAYSGLKSIEKELPAKTAYTISKTSSQYEEDFKYYAKKGYNLIFGHGFEYQDAAKKIAVEYPDTTFILTSGDTVGMNVTSIVFELEEAVYLLGMLSGEFSQSGKVGLIGGRKIPSIESTFHAFSEGAKATNPTIEIMVDYIGDFENQEKAKKLALSQVNQGVDIIFHNANAAGIGVINAVSESRKEGKSVYALGSNQNQNELAQNSVLASAVIDPSVFVRIAQQVKEGKFEPKVMMIGMGPKDEIKLVYNPRIISQIPVKTRTKIEEVRENILAGNLKAPRPQFLKLEKEFELTDEINVNFHLHYNQLVQKTKKQILQGQMPVLIAFGNNIKLLYKGQEKTSRVLPAQYHSLKSIGHLALGLYTASLNYQSEGLSSVEIDQLTKEKDLITEALSNLQIVSIPPDIITDQKKIIDESIKFLDQIIEEENISTSHLNSFTSVVSPYLLEGAAVAAQLELKNLHEIVTKWRNQIKDSDWRNVKILICGPHQPRHGHVTTQYFRRLLNEKAKVGAVGEDRIIYAENKFDQDSVIDLLARHIIDQKAAEAFFNDKFRLQRDLLQDGAKRYLDQLFPHESELKNGN